MGIGGTMESLNFRDFVSQLPRGDRLQPKRFPLPDWMERYKSPNPCFVEPDLIPEIAIESGKTSVVILSAPGAVGKSTVAAELAYLSGATLWDLSKVQVGSRTFLGAIYEVYEENGHGILKDLKEGIWLFVLDALDEAQVRAGSSNFDAFLDDLIEILKEPRSKPVIVLLARSDTATWIELVFAEKSVPYAHYKIGNFTESQAFNFIDKKLDAVRSQKQVSLVHRQQRIPFLEVRTKLFKLIFKLLDVSPDTAWSDHRVRSFLGYAPVLEALTDYLNHPNFKTLINELENEDDAVRDPWHFLTDIVIRLLRRESGKIQEALRSSLGSIARETDWAAWTDLYNENEQCRRVLEYSLKMQPSPIKSELPPRLAAEYESKVRLVILPQHPFLAEACRFANIVFKEYLYAWGLRNGYNELAESLRKTMRNRLEPFLPSQLFSRFILKSEGETIPVIEGRDFGVLYDSLLMRAEVSDQVSLNIFQSGDNIQLTASLDRNGEIEVECELENVCNGVHIWRVLKRADIEVSAPIELGLEGQRFVLGPSVSLSCSNLTVNCEDIDIDVSESVRLKAEIYNQNSQNLRIRVWNGSSNNLGVSWPNIAHPWGPYRDLRTPTLLQLENDLRGDAFRKFILMFRQQRTRKVETVMSKRWSPEQLNIRNELIELSQRMRVLTRARIKRDEFFEFNVEYSSLMTLLEGPPQLTGKALEFIKAYFGEDKTKSLIQQ